MGKKGKKTKKKKKGSPRKEAALPAGVSAEGESSWLNNYHVEKKAEARANRCFGFFSGWGQRARAKSSGRVLPAGTGVVLGGAVPELLHGAAVGVGVGVATTDGQCHPAEAIAAAKDGGGADGTSNTASTPDAVAGRAPSRSILSGLGADIQARTPCEG